MGWTAPPPPRPCPHPPHGGRGGPARAGTPVAGGGSGTPTPGGSAWPLPIGDEGTCSRGCAGGVAWSPAHSPPRRPAAKHRPGASRRSGRPPSGRAVGREGDPCLWPLAHFGRAVSCCAPRHPPRGPSPTRAATPSPVPLSPAGQTQRRPQWGGCSAAAVTRWSTGPQCWSRPGSHARRPHVVRRSRGRCGAGSTPAGHSPTRGVRHGRRRGGAALAPPATRSGGASVRTSY